jgi:hypothetical protein
MKVKGPIMNKLVGVLVLILVVSFTLSATSYAAEKMWKGLAPVPQPDGSVKFVEKPISIDRVNTKTVPEGAVGYWGFADEKFVVNIPPQVDTTGWKAIDYMKHYENLMGMVTPPAESMYLPWCGFDLIDKLGRVRTRRFEQWRRPYYGKDGIQYKNMIYFHVPAEIGGMSIFLVKHADPDTADDQWIYLPALRKVRRIGASQKMDSMAGSDYSMNEWDLDPRYWEYEIIREETIDADKSPFKDAYGIERNRHRVHGKHCVVIKAIPKNKDWPIGYELWWMDKAKGLHRYYETYDKAGKKIRTEFNYQEHGVPKNPKYICFGDWYAQNLITGHKTYLTVCETDEKGRKVIDYDKRDWSNYIFWYDTGYSDEFLTLRFMERGVR